MVDVRSDTHSTARRAAEEIVRTLAGAGHIAYFAGGCVRDELLGLSPEDYDVATDATPERLSVLFRRTALVGASFGVVLVRLHGATVEVATFRSDGPYTDKRRPDSVTFSDPVSDARRRDFTVNAMFLDPLGPPASPAGTPVSGTVIDHVGGLGDLRARTLRAVGDPDKRLAEDHLRALRAVRLAAKLGFTLEPGTADAIRRHARELEGVSHERIGEELRRILSHPSRALAIDLAQGLGIDGPMLGEPSKVVPLRHLAKLRPESDGPPDVALCLGAWLFDRGFIPATDDPGPVVSRCRRSLCLSNEESDALKALLAASGWIDRHWKTAGTAARKRNASGPGFASALQLLACRSPEEADAIGKEVSALSEDGIGLSPPPLVTGDRLIVLGMKPGPEFKRILDAVYDAQLEGTVRSPEEGLELARGLRV